MRVVTPFRPFPAESVEHMELGAFDWLGAIDMLRVSVARSCGCETVVITDVDTEIPGAFRFKTRERRLMLWILEVGLRYLTSKHFDRDTVMLSPDTLVYCDLRQWFAGEFGIVVRPEDAERPILNSVQWWPIASRDRLIRLYEEAIAIAEQLPYTLQVWGADSEPFRQLLAPMVGGCGPRACGIVANLVDHRHVLIPLMGKDERALEDGRMIEPPKAVIDFRYLRKRYQRAYFEATIGAEALAS